MQVSLDDLKQHLNLDGDADDALLTSKIAAAEAYVDAFLDVKLDEYEADSLPVPAPIIAAIMMVAAHLYENREATLVGVNGQILPLGVHELLSPYRRWVF